MSARPFRQVDVFGAQPLTGNPLAVVLDGTGLDVAQMQAFARWTNLSETTFVLPPRDPAADHLVRIFTPWAELPFAGHPTLGTAHAWLEQTESDQAQVVQECGVGLVEVRRAGDGLAFAAPPLLRSQLVDRPTLQRVIDALGPVPRRSVDWIDARWTDNGPGWITLRLDSAADVLALEPDFAALPGPIGVVGPHSTGGVADFEVRAFIPGAGVLEDPVTGSLNAGVAQWFLAEGLASAPFTTRQGTAIGRDGRVRVEQDDGGRVWVAGACTTILSGTADL